MTPEYPLKWHSTELNDNPENLKARKDNLHNILEEKGTSMWFSGTGSGERAAIFIPIEGALLRPIPTTEKVTIVKSEKVEDDKFNLLHKIHHDGNTPNLKWAVDFINLGETFFEDSNEALGVRRSERVVLPDGAVHDCDTFDYSENEETTLSKLEQRLQTIFLGDPLKTELTLDRYFETVGLDHENQTKSDFNITF
jgi:hypothetical protein